jgi:hypothetical protein
VTKVRYLSLASVDFKRPPSGVAFDSTQGDSNAGHIGYPSHIPFLSALPSIGLDASTGITLEFEARIDFETHENSDRAGLSVIVVTDDLKAIEIAFWDDTIWAQNFNFTHAEQVLYNTTTALTNYSLQILGSAYSLLADNSTILSGALRDYSGASAFPNVYAVANFLFFGDNTTSARSQATIGDISLTIASVPLPPAMVLMLTACIGLTIHGHR